ncbi:MAG: DNA (cytosine-5-)-methyltransferase [Shewanella sp.]|nr:DNA (cytosine-5-)-methyltransferase [Shewanella sp.]MCF1437209.1 DNA (cytosine-5-)-methyltransferase [Shewanella sp.]MCF1459477.1 DNA (cytosine-5-)-methyltransferase [Shewanella sp.]
MLKVLDLFSGIGGFSIGLERAGLQTIAFCEIDRFCHKILKQHWPDIPVFSDIRELTADELPAKPDVVCGGYPCQPFSVAGKQRGKDDDRHIWPEMYRIIKETRPGYVIAENVPGHINMGLDDVLSDLESEGYTPWPFVIPACALNARHRRDRIWIVGNSNVHRQPIKSLYDDSEIMPFMGNTQYHGSPSTKIQGKPGEDGRGTQKGKNGTFKSEGTGRYEYHEIVADTESIGVQGRGTGWQPQPQPHDTTELPCSNGKREWQSYWEAEPTVGRVANGIPNRVDRIKALGNAVVPQIPQIIGEMILYFHSARQPINPGSTSHS